MFYHHKSVIDFCYWMGAWVFLFFWWWGK